MRRNLEILIYNFEQKNEVSQKFLRENVEKIFKYLKKQQNSISLVLVSSLEMKQKNYYWRRKNKATTVLTFSEGDIFLCPKEIKKQALKRKISQKKLYQLLLVHSILHLFDYTHDSKKDTKRMECLEAKIINSLSN